MHQAGPDPKCFCCVALGELFNLSEPPLLQVPLWEYYLPGDGGHSGCEDHEMRDTPATQRILILK